MDRDTGIRYLKGVGEKRAGLLNKLGIFTVGDLLRFYPKGYTDWSKTVPIAAAPFDSDCCVKAIVNHKPKGAKIRKGLTLYKTVATDGESLMDITIFNSKFAAQRLEAGEEYLFYGKVGGNFRRREMNSPQISSVKDGEKIRPSYHLTAGINSAYIEKLVKQSFADRRDYFDDCLPLSLREKLCLMDINQAVYQLHFPSNEDLLSEARRRLVLRSFSFFSSGL